MEVSCQIDKATALKTKGKLVFSVPNEEKQDMMNDIGNFLERDLILDIRVDEEREAEKLEKITPDQRSKIYALFDDFEKHTGQSADTWKNDLKLEFKQNTDYPREQLSFRDCQRETASDFIEFVIDYAWKNGVPINDDPKEILDDIEKAMQIFLENEICAACGKEGADTHHVDAIGAGHDRTEVDDSDKRKIALCRAHHSEAHDIGWERFKEDYHVKGVIHND